LVLQATPQVCMCGLRFQRQRLGHFEHGLLGSSLDFINECLLGWFSSHVERRMTLTCSSNVSTFRPSVQSQLTLDEMERARGRSVNAGGFETISISRAARLMMASKVCRCRKKSCHWMISSLYTAVSVLHGVGIWSYSKRWRVD
jgi:hypothetical protein